MPEKMDYIIIGVGLLAAVLISSYVPSLVKASGPATVRTTSASAVSSFPATIENISGIDMNSLNIAKRKELI